MKPEVDYHKYLNGDASHAGEQDELRAFLEQSGKLNMPVSQNKAAIWDAIESEIDEEEAATNSFKFYWIAASISLLLVIGSIFYFQTNVDYTTTVASLQGETQTVTLQDGSSVILNANSEVSYAKVWDRNISLKGEAFFEVTKGETFTVHTDFGDVTVLGTSFNVFARDDEFNVACKTGKVRVTIPEQDFVTELSPGEGVFMDMEDISKQLLTTNSIGIWQTGVFHFDDQPVMDVLNELERQFGVKVKVANNIDKRFTGYFSKTDLEEALIMVCEPLGLKYKIANNNKSVNIQLK